MKKWLYKILMLVAVATVVLHATMPHHHHVDIQVLAHHNAHDEDLKEQQNNTDHHNIFSFAQIEEDFLPSQISNAKLNVPVLYLITPVISLQFDYFKEQSKSHFGYYREFPPPDNYSASLFCRPPPETFLS